MSFFPLMGAQPAHAQEDGPPAEPTQQDPEYTSNASASATTIGASVTGTLPIDTELFPSAAAASEDTQVYDRDVEYLLDSDGWGLVPLVDLVNASALYAVTETDREAGYAHAWTQIGDVTVLELPLLDPVLEAEALAMSAYSDCRNPDADRFEVSGSTLSVLGNAIDLENPEGDSIEVDIGVPGVLSVNGLVQLFDRNIDDDGDVLSAEQTVAGVSVGLSALFLDVGVDLPIGSVATEIDCSEGPAPEGPQDELWAQADSVDLGLGGLLHVDEQFLPSSYIGAPDPVEEEVTDSANVADISGLNTQIDLPLLGDDLLGAGAVGVSTSGYYGEEERWAEAEGTVTGLSLLADQLGAEVLHGEVRLDCFAPTAPPAGGSQFGEITLLGETYEIGAPDFELPVEIDVLGDLVSLEGTLSLFSLDDNTDSAFEDGYLEAAMTMIGLDASVQLLGLNQSLRLGIGDLEAYAPCAEVWQASLGVSVESDVEEPVSAGDEVPVTAEVVNNGDVPVTVDEVTADPELDEFTCEPELPAMLAPGESLACDGTYTVTEDDEDAGEVTIDVTASGEDDEGEPVEETGSLTLTVVPEDAELVEVRVEPDEVDIEVGESTQLEAIAVYDDDAEVNVTDAAVWESADDNTATVSDNGLVTGQGDGATEITATYEGESGDAPVTVTEPELEVVALQVEPSEVELDIGETAQLTATAIYEDTSSEVVTDDADWVSADPETATVNDTGLVTGIDGGTTEVTASYEGVSDEAEVTVVDPDPDLIGIEVIPDETDVVVDETEQLAALATFDDGSQELVTGEADWVSANPDIATVDGGLVTGEAPGTTDVTATYEGESDSAAVTVVPLPPEDALSLDKTADPDSFSEVGDEITYTLTATNTTEDHTILDVTITDEMFPDLECGPEDLAPGETLECVETYTITEDDVDAGEVVNTASTTGEDEDSGVEVGDDDELTVPHVQLPPEDALSLDKSAEPDSFSDVGDEVTYTFTVTNTTDDHTIVDIEVTDDMFPDMDCTIDELAPGASFDCDETYTITQADVDAGEVVNAAAVTGEDDDTGEDVGDDDEITVPGPDMDASLDMEKTVDTEGPVWIGDEITYTLTATNDGNVTISDVVITDEMFPDMECGPVDLAPGDEPLVCTEIYTVTEDDADVGSVTNTASVEGEDPTGEDTEDTDTIEITVEQVIDELEVVPPTADLEPGDTQQFEAWVTYEDQDEPVDVTGDADWTTDDDTVVTVDDDGLATAQGEGQTDVTATFEDETDSAQVTVTDPALPPEDALVLDKTADPDSFSDVGDEITYTLTATNTTDEHTILDVTITDEMFPDMECGPETLEPGETLVCTETYTITQDDVDTGEVVNAASTSGEDEGSGEDVDDDDDITIPYDPEAPACPPSESSTEGLERLSGENRVDTALAISQDRWTDECVGEFDSVVLARADVYADALAGTPLAADVEAPILITASNELYDNVAAEIDRLLPGGDGTVYLLGGTEALDETVEADVAEMGYDITRLGGPSRFETAGLIAEHLGDRDNVLVATGADHPDALASGTAAAANDGVVLLSVDDQPHQVVDEYLDGTDAQAWAIGGAASAAYPNLTALVGATRDGTAVAVAEQFFDEPTHVAIARRDDFPDALGGGAHIGAYGGPLLLSYPTMVPDETAAYLETLSPTGGYVYGGTHAVDEDTFSELEGYFDTDDD